MLGDGDAESLPVEAPIEHAEALGIDFEEDAVFLQDGQVEGQPLDLRDQLSRWCTNSGRAERRRRGSQNPPVPPAVRPHSPRQWNWLLARPPSSSVGGGRAYLDPFLALSPEVAATYTLAQASGGIVRERDHSALDAWLIAGGETDLPEPVDFAAGIHRDQPAVDQMLLSEWSNGQTEGQINPLNMLKRQMYGRAKFDLLRQRVLRFMSPPRLHGD